MNDKVIMGWDAGWTPNGSGAWAVASGEKLLLHETTLQGEALLSRLEELLAQWRPSIIAMDFPLAIGGVREYRAADLETTRSFSRYGCPVHSPSPERPGRWGEQIVEVLRRHGYEIGVSRPLPARAVVEVYPHTALLEIKRLSRRLPYKASRSASYWPGVPLLERVERLLETYRDLWAVLNGGDFPDVGQNPILSRLKSVEDLIDALVCLHAGRQVCTGGYQPYGDEMAAIWNPVLSPAAVPGGSVSRAVSER